MSQLADCLTKASRGIISDIRSEWSKSKVEGNAEIDFQVTNDDYDIVRGTYTARGQKMWILEHGKGSKMDDGKENPGLADYKRSDLWNRERGKAPGNDPSGNEIRSRGPYRDLDGNWHEGSSMAMPHGLNLEWATAGNNRPFAKVATREGHHYVRDNVMPKEGTSARIVAMEDDIFNAIGNAVDIAVMRGKIE